MSDASEWLKADLGAAARKEIAYATDPFIYRDLRVRDHESVTVG